LEIYTLGFTKKTAEQFFEIICQSSARSLTDVRRNPDSQLSGFAKGRDLKYLLPKLTSLPYRLELLLAPSQRILQDYRSKKLSWSEYEVEYLLELAERQVEHYLSEDMVDGTIFLCSEDTTAKCHRRLSVEYLSRHWGPIKQTDL
jgi:uncharacterized protein (DUF488 family)